MVNEQSGNLFGTYVTIDIRDLKLATDEDIETASGVVKDELKKIIDSHCDSQDEMLLPDHLLFL